MFAKQLIEAQEHTKIFHYSPKQALLVKCMQPYPCDNKEVPLIAITHKIISTNDLKRHFTLVHYNSKAKNYKSLAHLMSRRYYIQKSRHKNLTLLAYVEANRPDKRDSSKEPTNDLLTGKPVKVLFAFGEPGVES